MVKSTLIFFAVAAFLISESICESKRIVYKTPRMPIPVKWHRLPHQRHIRGVEDQLLTLRKENHQLPFESKAYLEFQPLKSPDGSRKDLGLVKDVYHPGYVRRFPRDLTLPGPDYQVPELPRKSDEDYPWGKEPFDFPPV
ncbi:hypothetical protein B5X24_HaOG211700 [Helicoverpa armigera]|nr:hypothetical protein B5X24_HaOG211700 [Helicoverpa armigera]